MALALAILFTTATLISILALAILPCLTKSTELPLLVVRVDDIQDFAFKDAQLFLLNYSVENKLPLSLAVITGQFGLDTEIVGATRSAIASGSEVTVHGWQHENLAELSLIEQMRVLSEAKTRLKEVLNVSTTILTPPMFSFNNETLTAMKREGYTILSTSSDLHDAGIVAGIINIPATVELSDFANGTWAMKSKDLLNFELKGSVQTNGYAVLVTHPQEFIKNGVLDKETVTAFIALIQDLQKTYQLVTLETLGELKYR
jgi:peptidoglycan/xylan/chitin deacetylase (PgdA/CDA1 family)